MKFNFAERILGNQKSLLGRVSYFYSKLNFYKITMSSIFKLQFFSLFEIFPIIKCALMSETYEEFFPCHSIQPNSCNGTLKLFVMARLLLSFLLLFNCYLFFLLFVRPSRKKTKIYFVVCVCMCLAIKFDYYSSHG